MNALSTGKNTARWGFRMTCVWFVIYLLATQVLLSVAVLLGLAWHAHLPFSKDTLRYLVEDSGVLLQVSLMVNVLSAPLIALMVFSKKGSSWRDYMAWRGVSIWRVILWCMLCVLAVYSMGVLHHVLGWPESTFMGKMAQIGSPMVMVLAVVVAAPIFEEMVFRGFMYGGFESSMGAMPAVLLTSVIFAMMHAFQYNGYELLHMLVLGLMLGLARMRTQSLWVPIAMHAVNNGLSIAAFLLESR